MSTALMDVSLDYNLWLGRVDRVVERRWDFTLCPDVDYRPWFDAGYDPATAAEQILSDAIQEAFGPESMITI